MSTSSFQNRSWGPSHQRLPPPGGDDNHGVLAAIALILAGALFLHSLGLPDPFASPLRVWLRDGAILATLILTIKALRSGRLPHMLADHQQAHRPDPPDTTGSRQDPGELVRAQSLRLGGGAYLGVRPGGAWVTADPEHAVMILGPPRSGKTSAIVIPSLLAAPGAVVSTATKRDVLDATWRARSQIGQVWLFDPTGDQSPLPSGIRRLAWSPVSAASTWDDALLTARAMAAATSVGHGTTNEHHWRERSTALLAPLLYAAHLTNQPIAEVLRWILRADLGPPGLALEDHDAHVANDVLIGIAKTDQRERSSIFSATAGVLAAYNADATRNAAANPNFNPTHFPNSTDTIYITAPAHRQALCAPLIVGLLEQIRHATYTRATNGQLPDQPPVYFCLDEVANIAPIHDLPALVSEAGGQHLHILICLQDLSQARTRWGQDAADGFLTLFQTKLILNNISDPHTLEAISLTLGEYDRQLATHTQSRTETRNRFYEHDTPPTDTQTITHQTTRQRTLPPGEIAQLPAGRGLLLRGTQWGLLRLTPWHRTQPWTAVARAQTPGRPHLAA
jgi:type IV secretion system protein VirD4